MNNDLTEKYSKGTIAIHWITALLIFILFPLGKYMSGLDSIDKMGLIKVHAILGMLVFVLSIIRGILFFTAKRPQHLRTSNKLNDYLAMGVQRTFYFLLISLAISGIATLVLGGYIEAFTSSPQNIELILPKADIRVLSAHEVLSLIMMILIFLHIAGVIRHIVRTKENVLKRITLKK